MSDAEQVPTSGAAQPSAGAGQATSTSGGTQPSADAVLVTPDVIVKLAGLLRETTAPMDRAESALASLNGVRPGEFPDGDELRKFVGSGRDGRIRNIMENNARVREQLQKVAAKLEEMARRYTSADELNKHFLEEMAPVFSSFSGSALSGAAGGVMGSSTGDLPAIGQGSGKSDSTTESSAA
ncbi:hypothetical protein [Kitasatospora indigofera]|uniref:hypothetical protein n=1 Tax=Kitasatospora indigofera TaxID=67307 RepID=UPI0036A43DD6